MFVYKQRDRFSRAVDMKRCRATVAEGGRSVSVRQCGKPGTIEREHEGKKLRFCPTHDPVAEAKRRSERDVEYKRKSAREEAKYERDDLAAKIADALVEDKIEASALRRLVERYKVAKEKAR